MMWDKLDGPGGVRTATKIEFTAEYERRHFYVRLLSGKWSRTYGSPPTNSRCIRGRVYEQTEPFQLP